MKLRPMLRTGVALGLACVASLALATPGAAAQQSALIVTPGAGPVSTADAQRRADFVIYLPTYLPPGAGQPRLIFAPEDALPGAYVPNRVYVTYGGGITLWQMPTIGRPLRHPAVPISLGGRMGWVSNGPGAGKASIEWIQGNTQLGIAAPLPVAELFKIEGSAVPAAPDSTMAPPSAARLRSWQPEGAAPAGIGGIGIMLAPGLPPTVSAVEPASPAAGAGLQPGDIIAAVDGRPAENLTMAELTDLIRGPVGTEVRLTLRRHQSQVVEVVIRRAALSPFDRSDVTPAQARRLVSFPLLQPGWLPPGCHLFACEIVRQNGKPSEVRLVYHAVGRPLLLITQMPAGAHRPAPGPGAERVSIGGAVGMLNLPAGLLSWASGGTAVSLQSHQLERDIALNIARSMR